MTTIQTENLTKSLIEKALREVLTDRLKDGEADNEDAEVENIAFIEDTIEELAREIYQNIVTGRSSMLTSVQSLVNALGEQLTDNGCCREDDEQDVQFVCQLIFEELTHLSENNDEDDDEDGYNSDRDYGEGECVLCERDMPLTFHHLIPRTTHKKMLKRTQLTKKELNQGIMVCRPCHSAIHRFIDEETMALQYNTLERLLEHERVQSWIPYAARLKPVSKENAELYHQGKLRYRR